MLLSVFCEGSSSICCGPVASQYLRSLVIDETSLQYYRIPSCWKEELGDLAFLLLSPFIFRLFMQD